MSYKRRYKRKSLKELRRRVAKTDDGLIPLTGRIINYLVKKKGANRSELLRFKKLGYRYHPELGTVWSNWMPDDGSVDIGQLSNVTFV